MKNWRKILFSGLLLLTLTVGSHFALAQTVDSSGLYGGAENKSALTTFFAKFGMGTDDPRIIAARLIQVLLGFLGLVAVSLIMYAGWLYMTAAGDEKKIENSKNILKNAGIGLLIILSAFGIVAFVINSMVGVTGLGNNSDDTGLLGYSPNGGGGGFYVSSAVPRNYEQNVFRNDLPTFEFSMEMAPQLATSSNFSFIKKKTYALTGNERAISSTTDSAVCTVDCNVPFSISTSSYRIASLVADGSCQSFNGRSTTTFEHCLESWTEYEFEAKTSLMTATGLSLLCTTQNPCVIKFTTNDSLDSGRPVVTAISPAGGFCRNQDGDASLTEACVSDDDCQHWDDKHVIATDKNNYCDQVTPNAKEGNLITITGRHFGIATGSIYVTASATTKTIEHEADISVDGTPIPAYSEIVDDWSGAILASTLVSGCPNAWSDNEIVIKMPTGFTVGSTTAFKLVEKVTGNDWYDSTEDRFGPKIKRLIVNQIERPGLCQLTPNFGTTSAKFTYQGLNLYQAQATTTGYFGSVYDNILAYRGYFDHATINTEGLVPNSRVGTTTVFAMHGKVYGNYVNFVKIPEVYAGPRITGFTPTAGKAGQYVTITGLGFGHATLDQLNSKKYGVFFSTSTSDGLEASYSFPEICSDNIWTDKQIIIKAPAGLINSEKYKIRLIFPDPVATSSFNNITSDAYIVNNAESDLNPDGTVNAKSIKKQFSASAIAKLSPGLCKIEPALGQVDDNIKFFGEYFPNSTSTGGSVVFSRFATSSSKTVFLSESKASTSLAGVPKIAESGPVRIFDASNGFSNSLAFKVGSCEPKTTPSSECGVSADWFCCPNGSSYQKTCRQASSTSVDKLQDACFTNVKVSAYEWSFSTALDELKATCSGYSNFNSCMLSSSCPNTPGECQSGTGRATNRCDDDACKQRPECKDANGDNLCSYDLVSNLCVLKNKTCNSGSDTTGAKEVYYSADGANPLSIFSPATNMSIETENGNKVYVATGQGPWPTISDFIPVDTSRTYYLSARFKKMGTKTAHTYLGFNPFDQNKAAIQSWQVIRYGQPLTVTGVSDTELSITGDFSGWNNSHTVAHARTLAFYYSGDTEKMSSIPQMSDIFLKYQDPSLEPAYPSTNWPGYDLADNQGAYSKVATGKIYLNAPLPAGIKDKLLLGTSKVMDHSAGGTYLYSSAIGQDAPSEWTTYASFIQGEAFGNGANKFRPTTKFVKIIVGLNYMAPGDPDPNGYKEYMDDIIFTPTMCNAVGSKSVYQIDTKGKSCLLGTFMDTNGKCTIGTQLNPKICSQCDSGFDCNDGKCVISEPVCQGDTKCQSGECKADFECECCCKVAKPEETCCTGLKCKPDLCVNTATSSTAVTTDNPNGALYGQCTGCKVLVGGAYDKSASDSSCNCKAGAADRYCNVDAKVFLNGGWVDNTDGICMDAAQENQPCMATAISGTESNATVNTIATTTSETGYWLSSVSVSGYSQFSGNPLISKYLFIDTPQTCTVANATTTMNGLSAVCLGVPGNYYWVAQNASPCPSGTFMSIMSSKADSYCLFAANTANGMPKTCSNFGATSTVKNIYGGTSVAEITCEKISAWEKPFSTYYLKSTTTTTTAYAQGPLVGNAAYYWQADFNAGCPTGSYLDNNGKCTFGQLDNIVKCAIGSAPKAGMVANSTSTCKSVINSADGYWMIPKAPNKTCPTNTALAATSTDDKPWCIIGAKPTAYLKLSATSLLLCDKDHINLATTTGGKNYTCKKVSYTGTNALGSAGFCSDANLPVCGAGLYCDPNGCTCQQIATTTRFSEVRAGDLCIETGAGAQCLVGVDSCDTGYTNLQCLTYQAPTTGAPPTSGNDCRCCCKPGIQNPITKIYTGWDTKAVKDIQGNDKILNCQADKGSCSGATRGLFCGCSTDFECNGGADSCDLETCCRSRVHATSTYPYGENNCRNTIISMEFNEAMDPASFNGNVIVVADNETSACPSGSYLTTIEGRRYSWLDRLFLWARRIFNTSDTAYAEIGHNYCTVEGTVSMSAANKKMDFTPKKLLDANRLHYVIIRGDASSSDVLHEGVVSAMSTGIHDVGGVNGTSQLNPSYASSSDTFNGVKYFGYIWKFKTRADTAENKGVCLLDHITIDTDGKGGQSWLFKSLNKDAKDDKSTASRFDINNSDNDKVYYGKAFDKNNKRIASIPGSYAWDWSWVSANPLVAAIGNAPDYDATLSALDQQVVAQPGSLDRKTVIKATVNVTTDIFAGATVSPLSASADARIFLCNNPWPPVVSEANWPWKDSVSACKFKICIGGPNNSKDCSATSDCPGGDCQCTDNQFELYYCRDNSAGSVQGDFPAVNNNDTMPIRGTMQGACDAGFYNKSSCTQNNDCNAPVSVGTSTCSAGKCVRTPTAASIGGVCQTDQDCQYSGTCRQVFKEFYFMRDSYNQSSVNAGLDFIATPDAHGSAIKLSWNPAAITGASGFYLYQGQAKGKYGAPLKLSIASSSHVFNGLKNGTKYYFAISTISSKSAAESALVEAEAVPSDRWSPFTPANFMATSTKADSALLSWSKNSDDTVKYRLYYGYKETAGFSSFADNLKNTSVILNNLNSDKLYKFALTAIDAAGNESSTSTSGSVINDVIINNK